MTDHAEHGQSESESGLSPTMYDMQDYERRAGKKMTSVWLLVGLVSVIFLGFIGITWLQNNGHWF